MPKKALEMRKSVHAHVNWLKIFVVEFLSPKKILEDDISLYVYTFMNNKENIYCF